MGCLGERVKLLLIVTTGVMECLGFAGLFAGWPSLVLVLKKEDYFADLCPSLQNSSDAEPRNGTDACVPQDDRFTLIFTIGYFVRNFAAVVNGLLLDYCGILASRLMGIFLFTAGTLLIAFSTAATAQLIFPAFALIGAGGMFLLTTNIKVGNLFGKKRATVITLFTGSNGSSAIIFLLVKVAFEAGLSLRAIFLFISCLSALLFLRTVCLLPWKHIPYPLPEGFTYGMTCEKVGPMLMKVIAQRRNSTKTTDQVEGDGDERVIRIEVDARKGGGEMWGREDENELTKRDEGEGRGKTESGMETWRGETERDMSEGSRENEQVCSRETERENEERGSEREWQNGECRGVTEGDKEYDSGETDGEGETQKDRREEIKEENGEVSNGMEMVVVKYRTGGYPEARRGETEGTSDEAVEPERISGAGHEQPTAGVDLQHNDAGGSQDNENNEEVPSFRSCVFSGLFFTTLFWFSVLQLRFSFFIGSLNLLLNLMTNGDSEQVNRFTNAFVITQLFSILCAPWNGLIMDRHKLKCCQSRAGSGPVTSQRKADMQTAVLSLAITVMLSVLLSVTAAIPVPEVQYLSFVMFVFNRAFLDGGLGAFLTITFPPCHFGKLYGIARALNAIVSLLQYPLSILVNGVLQKNPLYVNIGFIVLVALAFVHPINVYLYCRRSDQQRRV